MFIGLQKIFIRDPVLIWSRNGKYIHIHIFMHKEQTWRSCTGWSRKYLSFLKLHKDTYPIQNMPIRTVFAHLHILCTQRFQAEEESRWWNAAKKEFVSQLILRLPS
jgi:hypothetical protein